MSQFYIMKAAHLTSSGRKLGLKKICRDVPNCTIIVATRHFGWNKTSACFITGCQGDYGVARGDESTYTIDTGNGYRNRDERLDIEAVLTVKDGVIVNGPDEWENRYTYVMK